MNRRFSSEEEFRRWNEEMFVKYNNERMYFHPNPIIRYLEKKRIRLILEKLKPKDSDLVLELGCGEAHILDLIKNGKTIGVDISSEAIQRAKEKKRRNKNIILVQGDVEQTPFPENHFKKIICTEVIEHVSNPEKLIDEIVRITRDDACIMFSIPNESVINRIKKIVGMTGLYNILLRNVPRRMDEEWHLTPFTLPLFRDIILGKLGIEDVQGVPFSWLPVRYVITCRNPISNPNN
ncbi:class I SAM-dependent methyltransferase [Candidatus Altiarchaeota archaeon]